MREVFAERRPEVVFHAAALKHLPLLEQHPAEAVKTNVWGTLNVLDAAGRVGVERFVNISTDKAADPISVLGYSKRIAERLTAARRPASTPGTYLSVRFGNVLGSRGSVLTAFRAQIDAGGPITVTHPDVTRYFMTDRGGGAARHPGRRHRPRRRGAGARHGRAGAHRRRRPAADRAVRTAESRSSTPACAPGEKLHEELFGDGERGHPAPAPADLARPGAGASRGRLDALPAAGDSLAIKRALAELCLPVVGEHSAPSEARATARERRTPPRSRPCRGATSPRGRWYHSIVWREARAEVARSAASSRARSRSLLGVDGVAQVVPGAVGDELDVVLGAAEVLEDHPRPRSRLSVLAVGADQVGLADPAAGQDRPHRRGVVVDVDPVADVDARRRTPAAGRRRCTLVIWRGMNFSMCCHGP